MENGNPFSREEVIERIETLVAQFLENLAEGRFMDLGVLKRNASALTYDEELEQLTHNDAIRTIKLNRRGARKYTAVWLVLQTVYTLLKDEKTATQVKREIYYLHPFFQCQQEADEAILDAGGLLCVPRSSLNIQGASKGSFTGHFSLLVNGEWRSYSNGEEHPITQDLFHHQPDAIRSDAKCIVVIEKDGIFNRLREDGFANTLPSILITGRGFPDLMTRAFVSHLARMIQVPVFGLCDCNPFGVSIILTYKLGSARMPIDSPYYVTDIKWVGLRPSQIPALELLSNAFKPLSPKDLSTANALLASPYIQTHPMYEREIRHWVNGELEAKVELEALHFLGFSFLSAYLHECITTNNFL